MSTHRSPSSPARRPLLWLLCASVLLASPATARLGARLGAQESGSGTKKVAGPSEAPQDSEKSSRTFKLKPPPASFAPPRATFPEPNFEWGTVLQGEVVEHDFVIKNTGGSTLRVERVKPSCGCTTTDFSKTIEPGQTGTITLRIDTKKFTGTVKKTAEVSTNASRTSQRLSMGGNIDPVVTIDPKLPRIEVVRGVETEPMVVTLKKASDNAFRITEVTAEGESAVVQAKLEEVKAGEEYLVHITPQLPDNSRKYHYAQLDAKVEVGDKVFDLPIRVSVTVKDRIEATPASVYFSRRDTENLGTESAAPVVKSVTVKTLDPSHDFEITEVSVQGTNFTAEKKVVTQGKEYRIDVSLSDLPGNAARRIVEKILVKTNDPEIGEIKINATASIGKPPAPRSTGASLPGKGSTRTLTPKAKIPADGEK